MRGPAARRECRLSSAKSIPLNALAHMLHMGDECHRRDTTLLIQLTPGIIRQSNSEVFEFRQQRLLPDVDGDVQADTHGGTP